MIIRKHRLTERQRLFCEHYVGAGKHNAALAARLAGYAPGCSHVTGCQLLQQPKIAATVRGLEEVVAREIGVSRQAVIAELVGAVELARQLQEPASMITGLKNVAAICGYLRGESVSAGAVAAQGGAVIDRLNRLSDLELENLILAGAVVAA